MVKTDDDEPESAGETNKHESKQESQQQSLPQSIDNSPSNSINSIKLDDEKNSDPVISEREKNVKKDQNLSNTKENTQNVTANPKRSDWDMFADQDVDSNFDVSWGIVTVKHQYSSIHVCLNTFSFFLVSQHYSA